MMPSGCGVAKLVAERGLSVRETENLVRKALEGESSGAEASRRSCRW